MVKVDLDVEIRVFCHEYVFIERGVQTRLERAMDRLGLKTLRDLCSLSERYLMSCSGIGKDTLINVISALYRYGLRLGMTAEELTHYELEKKDDGEIVYSVSHRNIDWERRKWELVSGVYSQDENKGDWEYTFKKADEFIKKYKESLNIEE